MEPRGAAVRAKSTLAPGAWFQRPQCPSADVAHRGLDRVASSGTRRGSAGPRHDDSPFPERLSPEMP